MREATTERHETEYSTAKQQERRGLRGCAIIGVLYGHEEANSRTEFICTTALWIEVLPKIQTGR